MWKKALQEFNDLHHGEKRAVIDDVIGSRHFIVILYPRDSDRWENEEEYHAFNSVREFRAWAELDD